MSSHTLSQELQIERMSAALAEEKAKSEAFQQVNSVLLARIEEFKKELRLLRAQLKQLRGGHGPGHRIDEGQLTLFGDDAVPADQSPPPSEHSNEAPDGETPEDKIKERNKPKRRSRKIDTSLLPREQVVHDLPEEERVCPKTGVPLVPVGEKVLEEIDYVPAQLKVVEHRQIEYGPAPEVAKERQIEKRTAPLPPRALEGCAASAGLIAQLLVMKYRFHLPLYRQEALFQQAGLAIPRQTLCDWVLKAAVQLEPIANELMRQIRAGPVLGLDDTPIKCQRGKGNSLFQAYLWAFVNPEVSGVVYRFTPGRSAEVLAPVLEGAAATYLVGDGYKGNTAAAREAGLEVAHAGCWAHVTRAFRDARKEARQMAVLFGNDIKALYAIEDEATALDLDAEGRMMLRRERVRPILARMLWRTRGWKELFSTKGKMADAIKYLLNARKSLKTMLLDGRIPVDNNACEQSIRTIAIGRKNWLFAGSERGGHAAAIAYTLIESCRLANVEPFEYLRDVLIRVATHPARLVSELVPACWSEVRAAASTS
ncbi:MAG: IS66 family transposase [bacterium]|nr:IS66 family transposase [bacterium]